MKKELKRVSIVIFVMFLSLFISSTTIQAISAESLNQDERNVRSAYDGYKVQRGAILIDGQPVAQSVKSDDVYRYKRVYEGSMYSAVTGFTSVYQGSTGLESAMDSYLTGRNSSQFFEQVSAVLSGVPAQGASIELTIDPKVQKAAWNAMGNLKGAVVALDPKTGNVLAWVSKPGFDANDLAVHNGEQATASYNQLLKANSNPLLRKTDSELYAPGSVFKILVAAAAFESGEFTPDSNLSNPSKFKLPATNTYIQNSGEGKCGGQPSVSIATALKLSCNIPFAQLGIKVGQDAIAAQADKFGFGKSVKTPLVSTPSVYPTGMDDAQLGLSSFGQFDVRVTPLQIAMISSAVANKGVLMKPNMVQAVLSSNLAVIDQPSPSEFSRPISETTADRLNKMMVAAVAEGVSGNGAIKGVKVAGKTGTAQNGPNQPYTLWFTGFAPADDPQVAVAVVITDGGGMGQNGRGNSLAAPVARSVMKAVLGK
jgi:peptidoglycan glycosyltransferase